MSNLLTTLIIAAIVILIALGMVSIGYLLTGKAYIRLGTCGKAPGRKKDETCGKDETCSICSPEKKEDEDVQQGKS